MPDDLLATLLQKAKSIQAAPPDRGWFSADTPHPTLSTGADVLKGFTGLGDQGPAGVTPTNLGQLLGAATPFLPGKLLRPLTGKILPAWKAKSVVPEAQDVWDELAAHLGGSTLPTGDATPAAKVLTNSLNQVPAEAPEGFAARKFLGERQTPSHGLPRPRINAPEGFVFGRIHMGTGSPPQSMPVPESPNYKLYDSWKQKVQSYEAAKKLMADRDLNIVSSPEELRDLIAEKTKQAPDKPALSGKWGLSTLNSRKNRTPVDEDMIRKIRAVGQLDKAMEVFPHVPKETIRGIIRGDTFNWVK